MTQQRLGQIFIDETVSKDSKENTFQATGRTANQKGCVNPTSKKGNDGAVTQDNTYSGENLGEQLAKQASNQTRKIVLKFTCQIVLRIL